MKAELDILCMEMIAIDLKPISRIENQGLRKLLKRLAEDYDPPSLTTLSRKLAPVLYHKIKEKLTNQLETDLNSGLRSLSFTTDC